MVIIEVSKELPHRTQAEAETLLPCSLPELLEEVTVRAGVITTDQENLMDQKVLEEYPRVHTKEVHEGVAIIIGKTDITKEDQVTEVVE